jgi:hypothetical protein
VEEGHVDAAKEAVDLSVRALVQVLVVPESVISSALDSNIKLGREEGIPAENQRAPMAGDVVAYLFP